MSAVESLTARRPAPKRAKTESSAPEVLSVIERMSLDPSIPEERIEKMIRREAEAKAYGARLAYDRAMTAMQPLLPEIRERGAITNADGSVRSTYAEWEDINEGIKPFLAAHDFNLTFRIAQGRDSVGVTAVCAHNEGHREETTFWLASDQSGDKNSNQARASSTSYGKRYTATVLLNLTSRGEDDDAQKSTGAATAPLVSSDQLDRINAALTTYGRSAKNLCLVLKILSLSELPASRFDEAISLVHLSGRTPIIPRGEK